MVSTRACGVSSCRRCCLSVAELRLVRRRWFLGQAPDLNWWIRYCQSGNFKEIVDNDARNFTRYGISLYWVVQTMMAVGYGVQDWSLVFVELHFQPDGVFH